jgi:hypothetical protein
MGYLLYLDVLSAPVGWEGCGWFVAVAVPPPPPVDVALTVVLLWEQEIKNRKRGKVKGKMNLLNFLIISSSFYQVVEKSPSTVLPFISRHSDVLFVRLIPRNSGALYLNLFERPEKYYKF